MENLYSEHGPSGYPGVNSSTTDDVMVFVIEADGNDCSCLYDGSCNTSTQGDWISGSSHPTFCMDGATNINTVAGDYQTGFFWPYIYMVCPDRTTTLIGQNNSPYSLVGNCASTGINNLNSIVSLSPNPVHDILELQLSDASEKTVVIFDSQGRSVFTEQVSSMNSSIDMSSIVPGIYSIKVGNIFSKFVKL